MCLQHKHRSFGPGWEHGSLVSMITLVDISATQYINTVTSVTLLNFNWPVWSAEGVGVCVFDFRLTSDIAQNSPKTQVTSPLSSL